MTVALMAELMKDDDTDMETDFTDPITERRLLGQEDDNNNPNTYTNTNTNNETQNSSDSTGLEGLTQKTPEIKHKLSPSNALNNNNLDTNQIRDIINSIPNNLDRTFRALNNHKFNLQKTNILLDKLEQHKEMNTSPTGLIPKVECRVRLPHDLRKQWDEALIDTSNTLLDILIENHNRTKTNLLSNIDNSHQFIYSNAPDELTASNIIQVTNDIGDKTNKGKTLRRFKPYKRHNNASHGGSYTSPPYVSTKTTSSTKTPINTPSRSIPNLTNNNNYNPVSTTQTLTPLMSCNPNNINPNTNNTRRINSTVGYSSPHIKQPSLLVPPARVRSQRVGSTITRNMSSPRTPTPYPFPFAPNMRNSNNNTTTNVTNSNLKDFLSRMHLPSYHLNMRNNTKPR